jgi:hypothetical protein
MRRRVPVLFVAALTILASARPASAEDLRSAQPMRAYQEMPAGTAWWPIAAAVTVAVLVGVVVIVRRSRRRDHWTELKR